MDLLPITANCMPIGLSSRKGSIFATLIILGDIIILLHPLSIRQWAFTPPISQNTEIGWLSLHFCNGHDLSLILDLWLLTGSLLDIRSPMDLQQSLSHATSSPLYLLHLQVCSISITSLTPLHLSLFPLVSSFVPASLLYWYLSPCHHDPLISCT